MSQIEHFVPGEAVHRVGPLARALHPLPISVARAYIRAYTGPDDLVLDPFCQGATVVREAMTEGRRVLAANFNPVTILAVRGLAGLTTVQELDTAITRLGDALKAGRPLREHLNSLYAAPCPTCHRLVPAAYFVWDRERGEPVEKQYHCTACGSEGLIPVAPADLEALAQIDPRGFSYWYVVDRVAPLGDPHRDQARRLLELYTPRAVYALTALLIKIETLYPNPSQQEALKWVLLHCLEQCSSLHAAGAAEKRGSWSHRLRPPARFIERNVWQTFLEAGDLARQVMRSMLRPGEQGRVEAHTVRHLSRELPPQSVALVLTSPPDYDYPFWALSYLWSGWLLGVEAAAALRSLLPHRRSDWDWYRRALTTAWRALRPALRDEGRVVLAFATEQLPLVEVSLLALIGADYRLESLIFRADERRRAGDYRLVFQPVSAPEQGAGIQTLDDVEQAIHRRAVQVARRLIRSRGEPLTWPYLHAAVYTELAREGLLAQAIAVTAEDRPPGEFVAQAIADALTMDPELVRLEAPGPGEAGTEEPAEKTSIYWWLTDVADLSSPLSDRVEDAVYQALRDTLLWEKGALLNRLYARFPGHLTPSASLIDACLTSYGDESMPGYWQLRAEDLWSRRMQEREEVLTQLIALGRRLGYAVASGEEVGERGWDVGWSEEGKWVYIFIVQWTAAMSQVLHRRTADLPAEASYLVVPGGRAALIDYKLRHNPLLRRAVSEGAWQIIKYRHLRRIVTAPDLTRHDLKRIVGLDPIIEHSGAQIPLF